MVKQLVPASRSPFRAVAAISLAAAFVFAVPRSGAAYPNMIRLGYTWCSACHVSPQGGGVLNRYGRGIDYAQTLRPDEPPGAELPADATIRLLGDIRASLGLEGAPKSDTAYSLSTSLRTAIALSSQQTVVYAFSVRSPTLTTSGRMGAASLGMSRLYWSYQPKEGVQVVVGRDEMPTGLVGNAFYRSVNNPSVSSTPTQAKLFLWNKRWMVTTYGYGPDGNETDPKFEARGVGAMVGANVWKDRAVVGVTTRYSKADAFDRREAGVFFRLGLNEHFGILAEHDVTLRTLGTGPKLTHLAGHVETFWVPVNWLQMSIAAQHLNTLNGANTYRLSPSAEVRLTPNFKLGFSTQNVYAQTDSRTYSVNLQVKAQ